MNTNNNKGIFSGKLSGLLLSAGAVLALLSLAPSAAQAQSYTSPTSSVSFGANGPTAIISMPVQQISNTNNMALASQGTSGSMANTSYRTGAAPEDAGMSGMTTNVTQQQYPSGVSTGLPQMTNGLMATYSVNPAAINQYNGMGYGFNSSPMTQVYSMPMPGGGGYIGGVLPVVSTGSVNANTTIGNGY